MNTSMDTELLIQEIELLKAEVERLGRAVNKLNMEVFTPQTTSINVFKRIPPSIEVLRARMKERGITSFTPESFHAYYESKGWKIGNVTMKNWDAALTTWANRSHGTTALPRSNYVKFYSYNEICQMALTNDNVWSEYVSLQLPDRPKPVWATLNDATTNDLIKYRVK